MPRVPRVRLPSTCRWNTTTPTASKRREALEREALQMAVANAMGRAEALAAGARQSIDRVLRIEESSVSRGGETPVMAMRMKAESAATPVAAGELEIRAQVRLTASLK